jgi:hypothetical protein
MSVAGGLRLAEGTGMVIVQLPVERLVGGSKRVAPRHGLAASNRFGAALQLMQRQTAARSYCAACAAPIDFGAVWLGAEAYCSVECSLVGDRPA